MSKNIFENLSTLPTSEVVKLGQELLFLEVDKIASPDILDFTRQALQKADPNFWQTACSGTGKYHPPEDQGVGGLVRHLLKASVVVREYARRSQFDPRETDTALSATILHDICKNGVPWGNSTEYSHGFVASLWLDGFELRDTTTKTNILNAVRYHMAPWCYRVNPFQDRSYTREEMKLNMDELARALTNPSRIEMAVRDADFWGSRTDMSFLPGMPIIPEIRHDVPLELVNTS